MDRPIDPIDVQVSLSDDTHTHIDGSARIDPGKMLAAAAEQHAQPPTPQSTTNTLESDTPEEKRTSRRPPFLQRPAPERKPTLAAFDFGKLIATGRYSKVHLGTRWADRRQFAIKVIDKAQVTRSKMFKYVLNEKKVLNMLSHPSVLRLEATFKDTHTLYLVSPYAVGGELFQAIKESGGLRKPLARFYAAQLVDVLEYLSTHRVLHRDLKPENIYIDDSRHLVVGDFGTSKILPVEGMDAWDKQKKMELGIDSDSDSSDYDITKDDEMVQRVTKDEQRIAEERGETLAASTSTDPSAARQTGGLDGKQQKALPASESKEGVDAAAANQSQSIPVPDPEPEPSGESDQTYFNSIDEKEQKKIIRRQKHRPSFCGTPEYMSPEILHNKGITLACDLYSLGVVIYQMLTASWPFKADTPYLTFKQTLVRDLSFPEGFDADAADLIDQLLARNPRERPGDLQSGGFAVLKAHPFFAGVDWHDLHLQPVPEMFVGPLDVALDADTREHILSFLDTKDVMVCGQVSQEWGRAAPTVLATRGIF